MTNKILSNVIDPEVLWKVKKTLSPCIIAFSNYFLNSEDMSVLNLKFINLCKNSNLENEQIRPMAWKIFLKVLPSKENSYIKTWIEKTIADREKFENIKLNENINSIKYIGDPLTIIAQSKNNNWNKFFDGHKLKEIIEKDINRTFQNLKLFQDNYVKELLTDILFYWCIQPENKKMSYRQGMNDLLSILFFAFFPYYFSINNNKNSNNTESKNSFYTKEEKEKIISYCNDPIKNARHIYLFFHDEKYIIHDLFTVFSNMMSFGIKKLFETPLDMTNNSTLIQEDFLNFKMEEKEIDIVYKRALDIYHNMLRNYDEELFSHLIKNKIDPTTYMVRWLRCLFCREFSYKVCIQLWDIIFLEEFFQSDKKFQFVDYICISMYENVKNLILKSKEEEILQLLFKYPQIDTPAELIKDAYKIRSFFECSQYQNQGNNNNNNKEIKIDLDNKNKNIKINQMTKKEKEKYDFDNKDINQNIININNINNNKIKKQFINTEFQINYNNIPNISEGITLQKMALVQKLKNIEKKYETLLQIEDDSDLKFIIKELYSKFDLK